MPEVHSPPAWFALHIRMRDHANVEAALLHKGFEVLSPLSTPAPKAPGTARRRAPAPLFPGYLFCSLELSSRLDVLTVPGVKRILGMGSVVTPVPAHEIESIRAAMSSGLPLEPFRLLEPGEPVEVRSGPLAGVRGSVVVHKGRHRVVIAVSALGNRAMSVEVDRGILIRAGKPPGSELRMEQGDFAQQSIAI